jgi:hypothetical protein
VLDLQWLAEHALTAFAAVHRRVFAGDPAANPRLVVEVTEAAMAGDTATLVIITPWTLNGLLFSPDDIFPDELSIADRPQPVFITELEPLGRFRSVNLVSDVSGLPGPERARSLARSWAGPFRMAVEAARAAAPRDQRAVARWEAR